MRVLIVAEGKHERTEALERLVRRLSCTQNLECETDRISKKTIHAFHGPGQGFFKRSIRWLLEAEKREFDALILLIDEDGHGERSEQINGAQATDVTPLPRALGVAVRTFDAWMLADEQALTRVLGFNVQRQRTPESIPDPKQQSAALLEQSSHALTLTELYTAIANVTNPEIMKERCPRGFRPFAQRISAM